MNLVTVERDIWTTGGFGKKFNENYNIESRSSKTWSTFVENILFPELIPRKYLEDCHILY